MKRMKVLITFHKVITTMTSMMYGVSQPNIKYIIQTSTINQRHYYHCEGHSSRAVDQDQERREHQVSKLSGPCHKLSGPCHKLLGPCHKLSGPCLKFSGPCHKLSGSGPDNQAFLTHFLLDP